MWITKKNRITKFRVGVIKCSVKIIKSCMGITKICMTNSSIVYFHEALFSLHLISFLFVIKENECLKYQKQRI